MSKLREKPTLLSRSHSLHLIKNAQGSAPAGDTTNGFPGPRRVLSVEQHRNGNKHDNCRMIMHSPKMLQGAPPSGGVQRWHQRRELKLCVCACVRWVPAYTDVDCCRGVQASSFFLPKRRWATVSRWRYSIFGRQSQSVMWIAWFQLLGDVRECVLVAKPKCRSFITLREILPAFYVRFWLKSWGIWCEGLNNSLIGLG